jgi:hypothetical protein
MNDDDQDEVSVRYNLDALCAAFASSAVRRLKNRGTEQMELDLCSEHLCQSLLSSVESLKDACVLSAETLAASGVREPYKYEGDAFAIFAAAGVESADEVFDGFVARLRA